MNPFSQRFSSNTGLVALTFMSLLLGVIFGGAVITGNKRINNLSRLDPDFVSRNASGNILLQDRYLSLQRELATTREEKEKLEKSIAGSTDQTKLLSDSLEKARLIAALSELEGPGVVVTLKDSTNQSLGQGAAIHDIDILKVVNELWASGAEAISVNNRRLGARSSARCVGPVVNVDGVATAAPVIIRAIGEPETLQGGLNLPGGVLDEIRQTDPAMVQLEKLKKITVPAFVGSTTFKVSKVPQKKEAAK